MKTDVLALFPHINATCAALILFMTVFIGTILTTYTKTSIEKFKYVSRLPLGEDQ